MYLKTIATTTSHILLIFCFIVFTPTAVGLDFQTNKACELDLALCFDQRRWLLVLFILQIVFLYYLTLLHWDTKQLMDNDSAFLQYLYYICAHFLTAIALPILSPPMLPVIPQPRSQGLSSYRPLERAKRDPGTGWSRATLLQGVVR